MFLDENTSTPASLVISARSIKAYRAAAGLGPTSELGHFQTSGRVRVRSVRPSTTDMSRLHGHVGFVPNSDETVRRSARMWLPLLLLTQPGSRRSADFSELARLSRWTGPI
jgi:hypothetical protein